MTQTLNTRNASLVIDPSHWDLGTYTCNVSTRHDGTVTTASTQVVVVAGRPASVAIAGGLPRRRNPGDRIALLGTVNPPAVADDLTVVEVRHFWEILLQLQDSLRWESISGELQTTTGLDMINLVVPPGLVRPTAAAS